MGFMFGGHKRAFIPLISLFILCQYSGDNGVYYSKSFFSPGVMLLTWYMYDQSDLMYHACNAYFAIYLNHYCCSHGVCDNSYIQA